MTFEQIEYFLSCASCLNFSLAAKYHYVSVSTLSRNLTSLEEELGVKLFVRGYHGHQLTREGKRFYNFAENVLSSYSDFCQSIDRLGISSVKEVDQLRIACYPFDNMFGRIVETVSSSPGDSIGKRYHVFFLKSGTMPEAVITGRMHIGVDTDAHLAMYGDRFGRQLFMRSPFKLVVGRESPLADRTEISAEELLEQFGDVTNFILHDEFLSHFETQYLSRIADLQKIGDLTQCSLPLLLSVLSSLDLNKKLLMIPKELDLPAFRDLCSVEILSDELHTDYLLFWQKNNSDPAVKRLAKVLECSGE